MHKHDIILWPVASLALSIWREKSIEKTELQLKNRKTADLKNEQI